MISATLSRTAPPSPSAPSPAPAESPPAWLPGQHFAAALAFFVAGGLGLVAVAPELARGAFFLPKVVAVVHLFVLGWVVLSIFGALCQFLPVAIGRPLRWQAAAQLSFVSQLVGALLFVGALLTSKNGLLLGGASLLSVAFVVFALNLAATLAQAKERSLTWWALAGAAVFLLVTPAYGLILALNLRGDLVVADRFAMVAAHSHAAILGFVLLVVVGVAQRLLPMFLLSHGASEKPAWASLILLFTGASVMALPFGGDARFAAGGVLAAGGVVALLIQAILFFRHRKRRAVDPGMRLAAAGLIGLAVAAAVAPFALGRGLSDPHLLATYFVLLLGAITLFVGGHYFKIVPFLVWYHRFGPLVGKRKVPKVADLYSERAASVNVALLVAGWLGLAASTWLGAGVTLRAFAFVFAAGTLLEAALIAKIARQRPEAQGAPLGGSAIDPGAHEAITTPQPGEPTKKSPLAQRAS